ncbi:hypothetical protein COCVIDRAFT_84973 [Bipolaris victoriae FI3]|uniref:Uncharacterized protein n=1 Tax=Bipolaris victoriae (strain FI3) TaxID=930091 RepID=W7EZU8_BIPV3|nr:hypothetical protein COCVIDRAFT_84973 [Bipolaris victoriae FI3]
MNTHRTGNVPRFILGYLVIQARRARTTYYVNRLQPPYTRISADFFCQSTSLDKPLKGQYLPTQRRNHHSTSRLKATVSRIVTKEPMRL